MRERKWWRQIEGLWSRIGLSAKMATIVVIGTIALVGLFLYLGTAALNENIQGTLQERVVLAQTTARHIDYVLANIEDGLTRVASQSDWSDSKHRSELLEHSYAQLDFYATRVFFVDPNAVAAIASPPISSPVSFRQFASVNAVLRGQNFAVSRFIRQLDGLGASAIAATPVRDEAGKIIGALVISIDLTGMNIRVFTRPIGIGSTGYIDLIDLNGTILASTRSERVNTQSDHGETLTTMIGERRQAVSACHDCHNASASGWPVREVLAFAPLEHAEWGVTVRQGEDEVFASIYQLRERIFALMAIMLGGALTLVYLTTQSVIAPVQALTAATRRLAKGDLDTPLAPHGQDEIGVLTQSFETMRAKLKELIDEIQRWNRDLDARVHDRTLACEQAREEIAQLLTELKQKEQLRVDLLHRVFSAQEEERKRISRELHDETCQVLTGLAYALDDAGEISSALELKPQLERMHDLVTTALEEIHRIILDLRPTMLDHLGLVPALRWYAESRFDGAGIRLTIRELGESHRLPPASETALFRVVQEAINNIARHSRATRADFVIEFQPTLVQVWIKDNGKGFNAATVFSASESQRGMGLMGMEERMSAVNGKFVLQSTPREGTTIHLSVPVAEAEVVLEPA